MYLPLGNGVHLFPHTFPCPHFPTPVPCSLRLRFSSAFASALRLRASPPDGEDGSAAEKEAALIDAAFDMVESGSQNDEAVDALTAILSTTAPGSMAGALALSGIARCRVATGDITGAAELAEAITGEYAAHTMEPRVKHALSIVLFASDPSIAGVDVDSLRSAPLPPRSLSPLPQTTRTATAATSCCSLRCSSFGLACLAGAGRSSATVPDDAGATDCTSTALDANRGSPGQRFAPALKHTYRFGVSVRTSVFSHSLLPLSTSLYSLIRSSVYPPPYELPVRHPHGNPLIHPLTLSRRHPYTHSLVHVLTLIQDYVFGALRDRDLKGRW